MTDGTDSTNPSRGDTCGGHAPHSHGPSGAGYTYGSYPYGEDPLGGVSQVWSVPVIGNLSSDRILRVLLRKWFTIALCAVLGVCIAFLYVQRTTPIYRASSLIEMHLRQPRVLSTQGAYVDDGADSAAARFHTRLMQFRGSAVVEQASHHMRELWTGEELPPQGRLLGALAKDVRFSLRKGTRLIDVVFVHSDPQFAASAADAFAEAAKSHTSEEDRRTVETAVAWLQEQAAAQARKLAEADQALIDYRVANNIDVLEGAQLSEQATMLALNAILVDQEKDEVLTKELLDFTVALTGSNLVSGSLPAGMPREDLILEALRAWRKAQLSHAALAAKYTERHPTMIEAQARVTATRTRLTEEVSLGQQSVSNRLLLIRRQMRGIREKINQRRQALGQLEQQIVERRTRFTRMERQREARDEAYSSILKRIEGARLSADENTAIVKIHEKARIPSHPIKPQRNRSMAIGLLVGLLCGGLLTLTIDNMDDRVGSMPDVEHIIGIRVLGLIPHAARSRREDLAMASIDHRFSRISEAFANVRSLLNSLQLREQTKSILVASAIPEEGKTITACNLAISFAMAGRRTLLVDFDMRRPRLRGIFGKPTEQTSLLHALSSGDRSRFDELPFETDCPHLDVITSLPAEDISPAETMGHDVIGDFMRWAAEKYDRLIIDSPPCGVVSDAMVLADHVGAVIIVCRPSQSRKKPTRQLVRQLRDIGANIIGTIINDVDFSRTSSRSAYDYTHPHSYYRYGDYHAAAKRKDRKSKRGRQAEPGDAGSQA